MVFATGPGNKAEAATEIMNRHGAIEIEKISASRPELRNADHDGDHSEDHAIRDSSFQTGRERASGSGARLFVW
jgi:hypothetical protein